MRKKNGFTLIELLAVIIILGVLMIIAIPSVTRYIDESRKNGYVSTAKSIVGGARNLIYSGELGLDDKTVTYYIDGKCISTDNGYKSPYGELEKAYVAVVLDGDNYEYYWMSVDDTNTGVATLKNANKLESDDIVGDIDPQSITPTIGIDKRNMIVKIEGEGCTKSNPEPATRKMNTKTGKVSDPCPSITPTIYWAINGNKLTISDSSVSGEDMGNFPGNSEFTYDNPAPWTGWNNYVLEIEIIGSVAPLSTYRWFSGVGKFSGLESLNANLSNLEVCNVIDMRYMFSDIGGNTINLNLSGWDASSTDNMSYMFEYAGQNSSALNLDLSGWNTSNVTNMEYMFYGAWEDVISLNLNLSDWDTSSVINMSNMFYDFGYGASSFNLNLNNWNVSNVTNMDSMFRRAGRFATTYYLGINNWNPSSVTNMQYMFYETGYNATNIDFDLSDWNTSNVTSMNDMFVRLGENATNITLNISGWDMKNVESVSDMFDDLGAYNTNISIVIPRTNGNGINNTVNELFGKDNYVVTSPPSGKQFTLAS